MLHSERHAGRQARDTMLSLVVQRNSRPFHSRSYSRFSTSSATCYRHFCTPTEHHLPSQDTSVNHNALTGDKIARATGEEDHQPSQIVGITPASRRGSLDNILVELWVVVKVLGHRGLNESGQMVKWTSVRKGLSSRHLPWTDAVALDSMRSPFIAECSGQISYKCLATGINRDILLSDIGCHRSDVDDFSRPSQG